MSQDKLTTEVHALERKLALLVNDHQALKKEHAKALEENEQLKNRLQDREEQVSSFRNQIKINKIAGNIESDEESNEELKQKIDEYIKEIDKCILHLSS
ncbi:MAG: hypothetical protein AAFQ98_03175 [Bacteroidota bacterium]